MARIGRGFPASRYVLTTSRLSIVHKGDDDSAIAAESAVIAFSAADTATGTEGASASVTISAADTATGADAHGNTHLVVGDFSTAAESGLATQTKSDTDDAIAFESTDLLQDQLVVHSDTASVTEAVVDRRLAANDFSVGSESPLPFTARERSDETATVDEFGAVEPQGTDSAEAVDGTLDMLVLPPTEAATATSAVSAFTRDGFSDAATATEATSIDKSASDSASGTESFATILATTSLGAETAVGADSAAELRKMHADSAASVDAYKDRVFSAGEFPVAAESASVFPIAPISGLRVVRVGYEARLSRIGFEDRVVQVPNDGRFSVITDISDPVPAGATANDLPGGPPPNVTTARPGVAGAGVQAFDAQVVTAARALAGAVSVSAVAGFAHKEEEVIVYATNIGDGTNTSYTVTHNFGTRDVLVTVYEAASPYEVVLPTSITNTTTNTVVVTFPAAPSTNQYRVVVITSG